MGEEELKNDFGNIKLLPKNTAQLADWQFKESVVEVINKLIVVANQLGATLSDQETEDDKGEENKSDAPADESADNVEKTGEAPVEGEQTAETPAEEKKEETDGAEKVEEAK